MDPVPILQLLLTDATADLPDTPEKAFLSHGPPAVDIGVCSLLAVFLQSVTPRPLNSNPRVTEGCVMVPQGRFAFQTWRCQPSGIPGADALTAASLAALGDALAIWDGITERQTAGTLLPEGPPAFAALVNLTPLGPSGSMAGWQILLDIELSRPVAAS